ncbi:MAG: hypothetical protein ABI406_01825 [Ktedonobacteraceae bacterium]
MSDQQQPRGVHLNGSIPLANAGEVFRVTSSILGERLQRIPDGETGVRTNWIGWQYDFLARNPSLELIPPDPEAYASLPHFKLRPGVNADELVFDSLGYANAALASYSVFSELKQSGVIPAQYHFQVSLPTPLAPIVGFIIEEDQAIVQPAYDRAMFAELDRIASGIPHDELAIQWDTAIEFGLLEGVAFTSYAHVKADIIAQLVRLGNQVPGDVELGYHLCYGDAGHKHFVEPEDTSKLVDVANGIAAGLKRSLNWISMPVPRNRSDDAYFAPLKNLQLHPETELYLGLVHLTDGVEGTRRRIEAAQRAVSDFGVATECGFGRRPAETIPDLLRIHSAVAAPQ